MTKRDADRIHDILLAAESLAELVALGRQAVFGDRHTLGAAKYELQTIGEAAKKFSAEFKADHPELDGCCCSRHLLLQPPSTVAARRSAAPPAQSLIGKSGR